MIKILWYQWGIVYKQSNVQIALLNFSLYYEWFNFYNPLLFSLHPTSLSKWKSQLIILMCPAIIQRWSSDDPAVSQQTPLGDFPCLGCWQITPGSPSGLPTEIGGSPLAACGFFSANYTPNSHGSPSGGWQATGWRPAGRWVNLRDIGWSSCKI